MGFVTSPNFNELRDAFPRHFRHHPSLVALTDHTLSEKELFHKTVWGSLMKEPEPIIEKPNKMLSHSATQLKMRLPPPELGSTSDALPHREHPVRRMKKRFPSGFSS